MSDVSPAQYLHLIFESSPTCMKIQRKSQEVRLCWEKSSNRKRCSVSIYLYWLCYNAQSYKWNDEQCNRNAYGNHKLAPCFHQIKSKDNEWGIVLKVDFGLREGIPKRPNLLCCRNIEIAIGRCYCPHLCHTLPRIRCIHLAKCLHSPQGWWIVYLCCISSQWTASVKIWNQANHKPSGIV